jgi:hypothetical protein
MHHADRMHFALWFFRVTWVGAPLNVYRHFYSRLARHLKPKFGFTANQ